MPRRTATRNENKKKEREQGPNKKRKKKEKRANLGLCGIKPSLAIHDLALGDPEVVPHELA